MTFIPPWQDITTLCEHICISKPTVEAWVKDGILPPARMRGGKRMWKWEEVDAWLTNGGESAGLDPEAERVRNGTKRAVERGREH